MRLLALLTFLKTSRALLVPSPPRPFDVDIRNFELTDTNRIDSFAPKLNTKRRLMVSVYLPIDAQYGCRDEVVPYVTALTAEAYGKVAGTLGLPDNIVEAFETKVCNISSVKPKRSHKLKKEYPIALFSPGYQGSRLMYGAMARSLASLGYIILTVDHTYEALVVESPDGTAVPAAEFPDNMNSTYRQLEVRTKDESFVISQLCNRKVVEQVFGDFPGAFDPHKVAVCGHSFGGSTDAVTTQRDRRVIGGLNFDGPMYGSVVEEGLKSTPYILVGTNMTAPDPVPGWNAFYDKIDAAKMEMVVKHTRHYAFTDVLLLLTEFKIPAKSEAKVHEVFGTLGGRKVEKAANEIMVGFLDLVFKKDDKKFKDIGKKDNIHVLQRDLALERVGRTALSTIHGHKFDPQLAIKATGSWLDGRIYDLAALVGDPRDASNGEAAMYDALYARMHMLSNHLALHASYCPRKGTSAQVYDRGRERNRGPEASEHPHGIFRQRNRQGNLPLLDQRLRMALDLADILKYVHSPGALWGDIST
ncbi:hypothetical protein LZL87_013856 [Fusarium oxysporum]|nr:hypothetical protein LZL87_013856 [Fusarium oxysporum]